MPASCPATSLLRRGGTLVGPVASRGARPRPGRRSGKRPRETAPTADLTGIDAPPSRARIVKGVQAPDASLEALEEHYGAGYAERLYG
ncbi:hypothetical protein [Streptomyces sp. NPDC020742]|uniref:hypothetical protein n=1 Tax=Streptomyces sp. NPDC020742 TaxID=3154897 RepID=UPI0033D118A6